MKSLKERQEHYQQNKNERPGTPAKWYYLQVNTIFIYSNGGCHVHIVCHGSPTNSSLDTATIVYKRCHPERDLGKHKILDDLYKKLGQTKTIKKQ